MLALSSPCLAMRNADFIRLTVLAAIWGASFLFMRILAPVLGPLWTAEVRVGVAGIAMLLCMRMIGRSMHFKKNWKAYLILGALTSGIPAALYSFAALTLPAGYSAIVNATTPLWGALIGAMVLNEKLTLRKIAGLLTGVVGVAFLVRLGPAPFNQAVLVAALACIGATLCYGVSGVYSKKASVDIAPPLMATGSQLGAALVLLPFVPFAPARAEITPFIALIGCALALLCSAVAYLLYFRLIADVGPTKAMTVTFLVPLFALIWGALFLGEAINANTVFGCGLVVLATRLVAFHVKQAPAESNA
jgi:drug/metabolite transporter (DMT)-like permease